MQKWEYAIVNPVAVKKDETDRGSTWVLAVNNVAVRPFTTDIKGILKVLGDQGWELVSTYIIHIGEREFVHHIFKRPKS